jgi:hypothetical protein
MLRMALTLKWAQQLKITLNPQYGFAAMIVTLEFARMRLSSINARSYEYA